MIDNNFFPAAGPLSLGECAKICGARLHDEAKAHILISQIGPLDEASKGTISFLDNPRYKAALTVSKAEAAIIRASDIDCAPPNMALIISDAPYLAYAKIAAALYPPAAPSGQISSAAMIADSAKIGKAATIGAGAVIGANVVIGDHAQIGANVVIGNHVKIGDHVKIGAGASLEYCHMGHHVSLHAGVRIGTRGFGLARDETGASLDMPQLGRVMIGDHVEIGANSTIDRGSNGDTIIGAGCKLDNLNQIAHNVVLGKGCVIAAQCGISGSTKLGDFVTMAGQAGIAGHLTIADQVVIAGKAGVTASIPTKGQIVGGFPARPIKQWRRQEAWLHSQAIVKSGLTKANSPKTMSGDA